MNCGAHSLLAPLFPALLMVDRVTMVLILPERAKAVRATSVSKGGVGAEADVLVCQLVFACLSMSP